MRLVFLIPLTIAIISGYLFQNCTQEMAYLTGTISIGSLMVSLFIAPWQVQLIIIIFAVVMVKRDWRQLQQMETAEDVVNSDEEKITYKEKEVNKYRGANYNLSPLVAEVTPAEIQGKYRGGILTFFKVSQSFLLNRKSNLKYRGVDINSDNFSSPTLTKEETAEIQESIVLPLPPIAKGENSEEMPI